MLLSKSQSFVLKVVLPVFTTAVIAVNILVPYFSDQDKVRDKIGLAIFQKDRLDLCLVLINYIDSCGASYNIQDYALLLKTYSNLSDYDKPIVDHHLKRKNITLLLNVVQLQSGSGQARDLGLISEALYCYYNNLPFGTYLDSIQRDTQYKNLLYFRAFEYDLVIDSAIFHLEKEFELYPSEGNYLLLFDLYESNGKLEKLKSFVLSEAESKYIGSAERAFFLQQKDILPYIYVVVKPIYSTGNVLMILVSLMIVLVWVRYLKSLKFFNQVRWKYIGLVFMMSLVFSELTLFLYDLWSLMGIDESGTVLNDFMFYIGGVGLIEETVKLLSVVFVLSIFKGSVKEPLDYVIYASVSALGFAFGENIMYFNSSVELIDLRAMTSTLLHMTLSSIAIYGYVLYKVQKKNIAFVILSLLIAVLLHGLYDLFLTIGYSFTWYVSMLILLLCIVTWLRITNNVVNSSPYFQIEKIPSYSDITIPLIAGLFTVVLIEYLCSVFVLGIDVANSKTFASAMVTIIMIIIVVLKVSKLTPVKGEWKSAELLSFTQYLNFEKFEGSKVKIYLSSGPLKGQLIKGVITGKINFSSDQNYLVANLVEDANFNGHLFSNIILKPAREGQNIFDANITTVVRIGRGEEKNTASLKLSDYPLIGTGVLNEIVDFDH